MTLSANQDVPHATLSATESADYSKGWRVYAWRRALALFLLFTWIPVSVGGVLLSRLSLHIPWTVLGVIFAWGGAMCWSIWYAGEVRCPRCRRRFGALGSRKGPGVIWRGLFDKICYNCKLRKFEQDGERRLVSRD